jgi:hypothetical protein
MDTNTMIVLVVAFFALIVLVGFVIYRRKARVGVEVPGGKLSFEATSESPAATASRPRKTSAGILGNVSIGRTRMKVRGPETIANNVSIGDTELEAESVPPVILGDKPSDQRE